ncbi:MAG: ABC transporter permease [Phycisphaerales bacterium]
MPRLWRSIPNYAILALILAFLGAFLIYPIALTLRGAFFADPARGTGWSLINLKLIFEDPILRGGILNSLRVAATTTTIATLIALPLAVLSTRYRYPLKGLWNALILVPLILPPFVGAIGVKMILGREGALNAVFNDLGITTLLRNIGWLGSFDTVDVLGSARFWGVVCTQALALYPIIYLNATASLANLDPALDESAENLGAGFWKRFFRITLPLIRPGLFAGGTIVFIWSFTELGTPLMFDYPQVTPVQIFLGLKEVESSAQPYALTLVMLTVAVGSYALGKLVFGGRAYAMYAKASRASGEHQLTGFRAWLATGAFALVCGLALLPHIGVILTALSSTGGWYKTVLPESFTSHNFVEALTSDLASRSINNSLLLSFSAVILNLGIGILVGYLIVRTTIKGRAILDALCMLPLAVPGLVMAFGYVAMSLREPFGKGGILASIVSAFGLNPDSAVPSILGSTPNPIPFLIVAYGIRRLPYIVRATVSGLEQTSGQMEEAAMNLGASRFTAVRRIIIPLIAANLIAGGLLAFSFAMLEVSDSLILAQQERSYPITKAIFAFANRLADGPYIASAMGVWGMALLTVTLVGASVMLGKRLGAIFRV